MVAQVNYLKFASRDDLNEFPLHLLVDPTARVDSQILHLLPATLDDDPTQVHNWCWSLLMEASCDNIPGQYVHPINPSVSIQRPGKPTFLFKSTFLVTLSYGLSQELRPEDLKTLPVIQCSEFFPYHYLGGACFVCKVAGETNVTDVNGQANCSMCGSSVTLNWNNMQHILEHMGTHILHELKLNASEERFGLCLRPAPMCQIYVKNGCGVKGRYSVDQKNQIVQTWSFSTMGTLQHLQKPPLARMFLPFALSVQQAACLSRHTVSMPITENVTSSLPSPTFPPKFTYLNLRKMACNTFGKLVSSNTSPTIQRISCETNLLPSLKPTIQGFPSCKSPTSTMTANSYIPAAVTKAAILLSLQV